MENDYCPKTREELLQRIAKLQNENDELRSELGIKPKRKRTGENLAMYTLYQNNEPVAYRYGESWVAQQLLMEGGYKTKEEAKDAWLKGE